MADRRGHPSRPARLAGAGADGLGFETIDGKVDAALVGHFDREPIFLYPELEERGWSHEVVELHCGDCEGGFMLRMVRWG